MSESRVRCRIPPHAVCALPVQRVLASAGAFGPHVDPFDPALPQPPYECLELHCSIEAATALIRQLCALRHTSARYDTALLTACAEAVAAVDEALERALAGQFELV
jgi:hypothetical protein